MNDMKVLNSDDKSIQIQIGEAITVTIEFDKFDVDGEMTVDYDEKLLTEQEATELTNGYFESLITLLENHSDKIIKRKK